MESELELLRRKAVDLENRYRQSEMNLRKSEDLFSRIFHASGNLITITTHKEGRIVNVNESGAAFLGYSGDELIGRTTIECGLLADFEQRKALVRKLEEEKRIQNALMDIRTRTGQIRKILFSAQRINMDGEACILVVATDISKQMKEGEVLRESEEKYRTLVDNSLQGIAIIQDGRFVFCNERLAEISGYSMEELLSLSSEDMDKLIHPDDRTIILKRAGERLAGKPVSPHYQFRGIKKDGSVCWLEVFSSTIEYRSKAALQLAYMHIDDRQKTEEALRESDERFRLIAETIDEVFCVFDVEKQLPIYLSPAFERIWGCPRKPFYKNSESFYKSIHPDDRDRVMATIALMNKGQPHSFDHRIIRPDGSIRYLRTHGYPAPDQTGRIKQYVGVMQDITKEQQAEEALKESTDYLNKLINSLGDAIFVKDREHKIILINDALCLSSGRSRDELIGKTGFEYMPEDEAKRLWEQEEALFETGQEDISEERFINKQGVPHTVMTKKTLLNDKDGNKQLVGVIRDITEYKELEEQFMHAQKMEAVGVLAGGVAHDFNNILSVINGYSDVLLKEMDADDPKRMDVEEIQNAGKRAVSLTSQLLAFSRKQIMNPRILALNDIIDETTRILKRLIRENIELHIILQDDTGLVHADGGQIQQIIMNLAINASDAMPKGGKLIIETANANLQGDYIRKHVQVKAGPYVMLAISDTGIGMDQETQAKIFEPFFTTKALGKGTGLGLSTCYGIVKQSNGFIWVYSEPGKGTTFKIYLPRIKAKSSDVFYDSDIDIELGNGESILIVEDEPALRALAARILRNKGYAVYEASNGNEALQLIEKSDREISLVLTDFVMPEMSGRELFQQIETRYPDIKVLFISGYTENSFVHHGRLGADIAFLQKPFTAKNLLQKVRKVLDTPGPK